MIDYAFRARFTDRLVISIEDGPERHIPVRGFGFGTTIKSEPYLSPNLNLGPNFCKQPCVRVFRLTNMGRRHQNLVWIPELPPPPPSRRRKQMQQKDSNSSSLTKSRVSHVRAPVSTFKLSCDLKKVFDSIQEKAPVPFVRQPQIFSISPVRFELEPGESIDITLQGQVEE